MDSAFRVVRYRFRGWAAIEQDLVVDRVLVTMTLFAK